MIVAIAMAAAVAASDPGCEALKASAHPAIEHANSDWIRALKAGDAAALAEAYADDGVFILPDGRTMAGREAVKQLYASRAKRTALIIDGGIHTRGEACGSGGLVYEWGEGEARTRSADGKEVSRSGPYLTVWKRIGGTWRIIRNMAF